MTTKPHYCTADFIAAIGWLKLMKQHHYLSRDEDHLIDTALYCVEKQIWDQIDASHLDGGKRETAQESA